MWVMWTLVVAAPEGTPDNNRKQQPTKRGSRRRSWPWFTISQMTMLRLYLGGCGLQTRRGCYAKATEHAPVLRVRLDKCGAPADWQIQFVQLYCRRGLSQECRCRAGEERLCMAQQWGNTYITLQPLGRGWCKVTTWFQMSKGQHTMTYYDVSGDDFRAC